MILAEWMKGLTWRCDICHAERPDEKISVHKIDLTPKTNEKIGWPPMRYPPGTVTRNVKYCNDNPACKQGAENWKEAQR